MVKNMFKRNATKIEVLNYSISPRNKQSAQTCSLVIGNEQVEAKPQVRNLGVIQDSTLSMENHVLTISVGLPICSYYIRSIGNIRRYLTDQPRGYSTHWRHHA